MTGAVIRVGAWGRARRMLTGATMRFQQTVRRSLRSEAERARDAIRDGLDRQSPGGQPLRPLAPMTLATRAFMRQSSTKILIERGELKRGVIDTVRGERAFVGVPRGARSRDGRVLALIGQVHELGGTVRIRMTPAMRRFLFAVARANGARRTGGGGGGGVVRIPARPFMRPAFQLATRDARPRWLRGVARGLGWRVMR